MISKEEAIAKFKEIIEAKSEWQLADSQFIEHLAIFASWALREGLWEVERAYQEFFRSTASTRASILAHVEDENYIPIKPTPSGGTVDITNNGTASVSLAIYQPLMSDAQIDYVLYEPVTIGAGQTVTGIQVKQLSQETIEETVLGEESFYEILFDRDITYQIASFEVYVDDELWALARKFQNANATDEVYDEFYSHNDQLGIRFGNDIFGKIPAEGSVIRIELWLTQGVTYLASGQSLSLVGEVLDENNEAANLEVKTSSTITGGEAMEDKETIRRNLQYWPIYNEQLVWDEDYVFFIKKTFPEVLWVNVWGEKEAEEEAGSPDLSYINTIFVSAYASGGTDISSTVIDELEEKAKRTNRRFQWVAPSLVTFDVSVTAKVGKDRNLEVVTSAIQDVLESYYDKDSGGRKDEVFLNEIYSLIGDTGYFDKSGEYFEVTLSGQTEPASLNEMVCLNTAGLTIQVTYIGA